MNARTRAELELYAAIAGARRAIPAAPPGIKPQHQLVYSGAWDRGLALALMTDERLASATRRVVRDPDVASDAATWDAEEVLLGWYDAYPRRHRSVAAVAREVGRWPGPARGIVLVRRPDGPARPLIVRRVRGELVVADPARNTVGGLPLLEFAVTAARHDSRKRADAVDLLTLHTGGLRAHPGSRAFHTNSARELAARHRVWKRVRHVDAGHQRHDPRRAGVGNCQFVAVAADASLGGAKASALWCDHDVEVTRNAAQPYAVLDPDLALDDPMRLTADELVAHLRASPVGTRGLVGNSTAFAHVCNVVNEDGFAVVVDAGWQYVGGAPLLRRALDEMITRGSHRYRSSIAHRRYFTQHFRFDFHDTTDGIDWNRLFAARELGSFAALYDGRRDVFHFAEWLDGVTLGRTAPAVSTTRAAAERRVLAAGDGARMIARFPASNRGPALLVNHGGHAVWVSFEAGELWVEPRALGLRRERVELRAADGRYR